MKEIVLREVQQEHKLHITFLSRKIILLLVLTYSLCFIIHNSWRYGGKNKCDRNLRQRERKCDVYSGNKIQDSNKYRQKYQKYLIVYM